MDAQRAIHILLSVWLSLAAFSVSCFFFHLCLEAIQKALTKRHSYGRLQIPVHSLTAGIPPVR